MDATQMINDSILESDEEENEEENKDKRGQPLAKLCILNNEHIPAAELPLFLGDNVLGRDPNTCTLLLPAPSVSKQHATICISAYERRGCRSVVDMEALIWDLGSMNGTRKGRLKLTPNVRYALEEGNSLVVADIPCQYVSCAVETVPSQGDTRTPMSRNSDVKTRLLDASNKKGGDTSAGSKKSVNGGTKPSAMVSSLDLEDTRKTPARITCLSFEQTPTQPHGTLVPESDSDSDGEGRRKPLVLQCDSDSHKSSPTCSTFLSPTNKIVPESEDESPITPSSSTKNRPYRHVSLSKEEPDIDVGRQQLKKKEKLGLVDNSEEEEEEERATPGGMTLEKSGQDVPVKQESNVNVTKEEELPVSTRVFPTDSIPVFNMDSDTDMEEDDKNVASAAPVSLNTNQQVDQPPNTVQFHMDSDTDVDEGDDTFDKDPKCVFFSDNDTKPPHALPVIQPEGITMDSDTDVDDDADMSEAAAKAKPTVFLSAHTADSAPSSQPKDFHLDSDTDVDEEEQNGCGTNSTCSKIDKAQTRIDVKPTGPESVPAAHNSLHLDSDTDDEVISAPAVNEAPVVSAVTDSCTSADAGADNSDTDVEEDSPLVIPVAVTTLSVTPGITLAAAPSDSDTDRDVDESSISPGGDGDNPADLRPDSDRDVEDKDAELGEVGEDQILSPCREITSKLPVPLLQNRSAPVQFSEGEVEDMETQAFLSPSLDPIRRAVAPAVRPVALSSCSDGQEDEDFVVAETQSFILQTRNDHAMDPTQAFVLESSGDEGDGQSSSGGSFQLGLSDSSHLQCQAQALAEESTQAFVSVGGGVNLEDIRAYAAISTADRTLVGNDLNLEATQAYGGDEEPARSPVTFEKEGQGDLALEATQAYITEPCSDSEDETEEDERKNLITADFPTSSAFAMAETQPVCVFREEESLATESHTSNKTDAIEEHVEVDQPEERPLRGALSIVETMCTSDDEDSILGQRRRKAKQLKEESQSISSSENFSVETQPMHVGVDETQPVATSGNEENDDEDSSPFPQKRKAKQLRLEEEGTETETLSAAETQPMNTCEDKESDDEDSIPGPRKKRKAKQLEEESQPISSSDFSSVETQPMHVHVDETQPVATSGNEESDDEDSIPGPRKKRKAKQLEEESQPISSSDYLSVETQPMHVGVDETQPVATSGNEESDDKDSSPFPQKRKAKQLRLEEGGMETLSAAETQPMNTREDKESDDEDSIPGPRKKGKAKPLQFEDEQTQSLTSSVVPSDEIEAVVTGEDMENDEELIVGQRKRKAKPLQLEEEETQSLTNSEASTVESQAVRTNTGPQPHREKGRPSEATTSGISVRSKRGTRARLREEEESSEPPRRQTRGNKAFSNSRGRKQKSRLDESDEEEVLEQVKQARGRKSTRHRKDDEEEKDRLEIERNKQEQQEGMLGEEKDVTELRQREREETEKERMKIDERERLDMEKRELEETERQQRREEQERIERKRKDKEEQERLQAEKAERLRLEQEGAEKERIERERWEEKERADRIQEQRKEMIEKAKQEEKERLEKEENERIERERKEQEDDVVLVRKTRSRSNSVSSEKSAASVNIQGSRGRGRGRGAKRTTEPAQTTISRGNNRRATVAAQPFRQSQITEQDSNDFSPQGILSRSNSSNSLNSEISISSQNRGRGRGGRQRGRGRTTEPDNTPPISSQSDQSSTPKPTARGRGRKSRKTEVSSNEVSHEDDKEKADSQQACATRGQKRANVNDPEPKDADEEGCVSEHSLLAKRNVRGRGQKAVKSAHDDEDEANEKRKGEKELKANAEGAQTAEAAREEAKDATTQAKRRGRASSSQGSKNTKEPPPEVEGKDESEKMEEVIVERRARGRPSVVQKKKKEAQEESGTCVSSINQDANMTSEPQTPNSSASRKRQAPTDSSPVAKTPRSASASPAAGGRPRAVSQAYKVLFTGVVDEAGERVLARLGGSMAKGVTDMNCLVTDKVRRTVKFLCAVAKGVPIVTTHWLEKSGKAGSFLSPNAFAVNDPEQEKKFNFCLQESLKVASSQPLLQGYEIHVTKSVKPEPVQMKDIISCSGATFLPKMPSFHKPQTVVISCEEDWSLCGPAVSASLPIVTAEFILTGILQQKFDTQTHKLPESTANLQPAGGRGRGRGRKKT